MSLYAILLLITISIPIILSFDKKLQFYKKWKYLFPAIISVAIIYIGWDVYMTYKGVWGFNPKYHSDILIFRLPLEEILFFIIVPYASLFLHYSFTLYFPSIKLNDDWTKRITRGLIFGLIIIGGINFEKTYTLYILITTVVALFLGLRENSRLLNSFYISFLLILIPFFIVNGLLTGSFINEEVVWYSNAENLGKRILTIPVEDFLYGFSMIFFGLFLTEAIKSKGKILRKKA